MLPTTQRGQGRLEYVEINTSDTHPPGPSGNTVMQYETLQLLSAEPRRQASARTSAESNEACGRKTKDRADRTREKKCQFPSMGFEPVPLAYAPIVLLIGPLRIDVTVTAKWPLWVLRNVTPFTPSHFRQSSEQMFLVFSFRFFQNGFFGICFQCFVNNISEKLNIFWTFS